MKQELVYAKVSIIANLLYVYISLLSTDSVCPTH